ncbi:multiple coagulation factor deficiency protein 2 homolog isoform X3 [Babylonia areolata]|uniref:multiple coagulation factor deficiency protein 2 homolog isoform X3 n=1 Tax=Babylonia areolata TaxID=304850 RepID=UPI003FD24987
MMLLSSAVLTLLVVASVNAHNPPGVPPRHDQQQQFQQQQMNVQEGQGQGHGGHHGGNKLKFQTEIHNADHILEHLQNVIKTKPKEQMSEEELEFHYFKMHDYDNNNKLDGVEIGKALTHFHDDDHEPKPESGDSVPTPTPSPPQAANPGSGSGSEGSPNESSEDHGSGAKHEGYSDEVIANLVDVVLRSYDKNDDGYVEYFEYKKYKVDNAPQR